MNQKVTLKELQPPENWGINERDRSQEDFKGAIWPIPVAVISIVAMVLAFNEWGMIADMSQDNSDLLKVFTVVIAFIMCFFAFSRFITSCTLAGNEAVSEASEKFQEWREDVLAPFLEAKYGLKIHRVKGRYWMMDPFYVSHPERGSIQVRVEGINWSNYYIPKTYCSDNVGYSTPPIPSFHEEPWLEEVIQPAKVSYRKLEEVQE